MYLRIQIHNRFHSRYSPAPVYEGHGKDAEREGEIAGLGIVERNHLRSTAQATHASPRKNTTRTPGASQKKQRPSHVESEDRDKQSPASASRTEPDRQAVSPNNAPLDLVPMEKSGETGTLKEVLAELEALRDENERLRREADQTYIPSEPAVLAYTSKVFYQIKKSLYLDEPRWEPAEGSGVVLVASNPIQKKEHYLGQHPEIAFAIYKEYRETPPSDSSKIATKDGVYLSPTPTHEYLSLIARDMVDAVEELVQEIPGFGNYFPYFNPEGRILAPYFFMYYSAPFIDEVLPKLHVSSQNLIRQLQVAVDKSCGCEHKSAKLQVEKGMIARKHLKYLVRPGDVLVSNGIDGNIPQAYIATGWIETPETAIEDLQSGESDFVPKKRAPRYRSLAKSASRHTLTTYTWHVPVWYWEFNGTFARKETRIKVEMSLGYDEESIDIRQLNHYPLQYADEGMRALLEKRGETFWSLRNRRFVSYMRSEDDELYNVCLPLLEAFSAVMNADAVPLDRRQIHD